MPHSPIIQQQQFHIPLNNRPISPIPVSYRPGTPSHSPITQQQQFHAPLNHRPISLIPVSYRPGTPTQCNFTYNQLQGQNNSHKNKSHTNLTDITNHQNQVNYNHQTNNNSSNHIHIHQNIIKA